MVFNPPCFVQQTREGLFELFYLLAFGISPHFDHKIQGSAAVNLCPLPENLPNQPLYPVSGDGFKSDPLAYNHSQSFNTCRIFSKMQGHPSGRQPPFLQRKLELLAPMQPMSKRKSSAHLILQGARALWHGVQQ